MPANTRTGRASGQGRFGRSTTTPRRTSPTRGLRRRQPEPSGLKRLIGSVRPGTAARKATPSSKKGKAGGLALLAGAAGMAFKNRGKLGAMRRGDARQDTSRSGVGNGSTATGGPVA